MLCCIISNKQTNKQLSFILINRRYLELCEYTQYRQTPAAPAFYVDRLRFKAVLSCAVNYSDKIISESNVLKLKGKKEKKHVVYFSSKNFIYQTTRCLDENLKSVFEKGKIN